MDCALEGSQASSSLCVPSLRPRSLQPTEASLPYHNHSVGKLTLQASSPSGPHTKGGQVWLLLPRLLVYTDPYWLLLSCPFYAHPAPAQNSALPRTRVAASGPPPLVVPPAHLPFLTLPCPTGYPAWVARKPTKPDCSLPGGRRQQARSMRLCTQTVSAHTEGLPGKTMQKLYRPSAPSQGLKCYGCLRGNKPTGGFPGFLLQLLRSVSQPVSPAPFMTTPHGISIQKAKGKDQKLQNGLEPKGPTLAPLQATPSRLLGKRRGSRVQGTPPSGSAQRLLFPASQRRPSTLPLPTWLGEGLQPQYLLIPKIRTPWSWGSLGMSTLIRDTVLSMKWTWSYLV